MKKGLTFILIVIGLLALTWAVYSKITHARREASYRVAMMPFERDLRVGMSRPDVQSYLDSRRIEYNRARFGGKDADTFEIKIGEEPDNLICEHWTVYVAIEFSLSDKLRDIHIRKEGTCL
ncbi:MAG: hypothetical protein WB762_35135 [Candidatus Sulfotelmatobacter sp.]